MTDQNWLENLDQTTRNVVTGYFKEISLAAGEVLFSQDDAGDSMYMVTSGQLDVVTLASPNIHEDGFSWQAVRGSIALPGIFASFLFNGNVVVDGGGDEQLSHRPDAPTVEKWLDHWRQCQSSARIRTRLSF